MRINSCRMCGYDINVYQNCRICKEPIEFICYECNTVTDKEIHSNCMTQDVLIKVQKSF